MAGRTQSELNRALEDLNDGVKVLLGLREPGPNFVGALLRGREDDEREANLHRIISHGARRRASRTRSRGHLVRIK